MRALVVLQAPALYASEIGQKAANVLCLVVHHAAPKRGSKHDEVVVQGVCRSVHEHELVRPCCTGTSDEFQSGGRLVRVEFVVPGDDKYLLKPISLAHQKVLVRIGSWVSDVAAKCQVRCGRREVEGLSRAHFEVDVAEDLQTHHVARCCEYLNVIFPRPKKMKLQYQTVVIGQKYPSSKMPCCYICRSTSLTFVVYHAITENAPVPHVSCKNCYGELVTRAHASGHANINCVQCMLPCEVDVKVEVNAVHENGCAQVLYDGAFRFCGIPPGNTEGEPNMFCHVHAGARLPPRPDVHNNTHAEAQVPQQRALPMIVANVDLAQINASMEASVVETETTSLPDFLRPEPIVLNDTEIALYQSLYRRRFITHRQETAAQRQQHVLERIQLARLVNRTDTQASRLP